MSTSAAGRKRQQERELLALNQSMAKENEEKEDQDKILMNNKKKEKTLCDTTNIDKFCELENKPKYSYNNIKTVLAIGDIHGDVTLLMNILKKNGIIQKEKSCHRIGDKQNDKKQQIIIILEEPYVVSRKENYIIVQTGDQLDGYREDVEPYYQFKNNDLVVFKIMSDLFDAIFEYNKEDKKLNYHLISLIGNHELFNIAEDYRYAIPNPYDEKDIEEREQDIFFCKTLRRMACHRAFAVIVNEKLLFSHAGLMPDYIGRMIGHKKYEELIKATPEQKFILYNKYCLDFLYDFMLYGNRQLGEDLKNVVGHRDFEITPRGKYNEEEKIKMACGDAQYTKDKLKLTHLDNMIVGHNINSNITNTQCQRPNSVDITSIDVGASRAFGPASTFCKNEIPKALMYTFSDDGTYEKHPIHIKSDEKNGRAITNKLERTLPIN